MLHFQAAKAHREHYNDKSGTVQRVEYFMLPKKAEDQFKKVPALWVLNKDKEHRNCFDDIEFGISASMI